MATLQPNKDAEVTINQQGNLTVVSVTNTITGNGTTYQSLVVPTGKKYILKGYVAIGSGGPFNIASAYSYLSMGVSINLTSGITYQNLEPYGLILNAGESLVNVVACDGYVGDGTLTTHFLVVIVEE